MEVEKIKATFSLPERVVSIIENRSKKNGMTKSGWLNKTLRDTGSELMQECFNEGDYESFKDKNKKGSVPRTFSIEKSVWDTLDHFSNLLKIKKSHLVYTACIEAENKEIIKSFSKETRDILKMINDFMKDLSVSQ